MKIEPRREVGMLILHYSGVLLGFLLIALAILNIISQNGKFIIAITSAIVGVLVVITVLYNLYKLNYNINEETQTISIQAGFFKDSFKFNEVKEIEVINTISPKGTLGKKKVLVRYKRNGMKDPTVYDVCFATTNDEEFINYLKSHCHAAKFITEEMAKRRGKKGLFRR